MENGQEIPLLYVQKFSRDPGALNSPFTFIPVGSRENRIFLIHKHEK